MSISERLYIQWLPDEASEPTSTIVLTTPHRRFVDLRFLNPPSPPAASPPTPPTSPSLEWGTAGYSAGTPTHGTWTHDLSSRPTHPDGETDVGTMEPHPSLPDVEIERGRMAHLDTGEVRAYEEAWRAVPVLPDESGKRIAVLLEMRRDGGDMTRRGTVVRVGQYCQGIVRDGGDISVQRWLWTAGAWANVGQVGGFDIPCDATWAVVQEGDTVERSGAVWDVKEVAVL
ncbi:uncharacterized protein TRAVEDRAFT_67718 [Trametes versicolor FP-101664 SS1]|uniref:Protein HRI1 n=1 Tax=Trametes versicolor (strain FP-101664) TaxID=717944 RepID=R7S9F0_TRAVS|nr:uncharacterized protein TRAVEDRAFT_67718 [Trametes versicolor FP-101664 SS1]EIW51559.1 hypothetical protein TRAVEDRAFT_67718 [Trametes versicolor FP-101664 SS1]